MAEGIAVTHDRRGPVAFLFLGETLLIPHLYPVVEELARCSGVSIDLWVSTSVHERLLARWTEGLAPGRLRIRRAPFFRRLDHLPEGTNPPLPNKALLLLGIAPCLFGTPVVVSAEQTSLWIPALLPWFPARFINIMHGSGTINARDDFRRRKAWRMPVPSAAEQRQFVLRGMDPSYVPVVGSVKACFRHSTRRQLQFPEKRPIVLYNPHWQRHRSSWWDWGRQVVRQLVEQDRYNVILAPHQRLVEGDPQLRQVLADAARHPHVVGDIDSFAMVDGSYTAAADVYLGDTSSQVIEFLVRPRPCVFLNNTFPDWRGRADLVMWHSGEVLERADGIVAALDRAVAGHAARIPAQQALVEEWLGETSGAPARIVRHIFDALEAADAIGKDGASLRAGRVGEMGES
jgi:hypothetical protein